MTYRGALCQVGRVSGMLVFIDTKHKGNVVSVGEGSELSFLELPQALCDQYKLRRTDTLILQEGIEGRDPHVVTPSGEQISLALFEEQRVRLVSRMIHHHPVMCAARSL